MIMIYAKIDILECSTCHRNTEPLRIEVEDETTVYEVLEYLVQIRKILSLNSYKVEIDGRIANHQDRLSSLTSNNKVVIQMSCPCKEKMLFSFSALQDESIVIPAPIDIFQNIVAPPISDDITLLINIHESKASQQQSLFLQTRSLATNTIQDILITLRSQHFLKIPIEKAAVATKHSPLSNFVILDEISIQQHVQLNIWDFVEDFYNGQKINSIILSLNQTNPKRQLFKSQSLLQSDQIKVRVLIKEPDHEIRFPMKTNVYQEFYRFIRRVTEYIASNNLIDNFDENDCMTIFVNGKPFGGVKQMCFGLLNLGKEFDLTLQRRFVGS